MTAVIPMGALTYGLIEGAAEGFGAAPVLAALVVAVLAGTAFLLAEVRGPQPMVPLEFVSLQARCSVSLGGLHVHDWLLRPGIPAQPVLAGAAGAIAAGHRTDIPADDRETFLQGLQISLVVAAVLLLATAAASLTLRTGTPARRPTDDRLDER